MPEILASNHTKTQNINAIQTKSAADRRRLLKYLRITNANTQTCRSTTFSSQP